MKKIILTITLTFFTLFSFAQDYYFESYHVGVKHDLSDQQEGTIMKWWIDKESKKVKLVAYDYLEGIDSEITLDMRGYKEFKDIDGDDCIQISLFFEDGEDLGTLNLVMTNKKRKLFAGHLNGLYFIGKYLIY